MSQSIDEKLSDISWDGVTAQLSEAGFALIGPLFTKDECELLIETFERDGEFRSHIVMERYRFGRGDYKYFRYPLPEAVQSLRTATYPHLAKIANDWNAQLKSDATAYPLAHQEFLACCHKAG